jgi:hypothetical protein
MSREIDAEVAEKVMGWKNRHEYYEHNITRFEDSNGKFYYIGDKAGSPWSPSTDIAAAFQVVEKMEDRGFFFELSNTSIDPEKTYRASFFKNDEPISKYAESLQLAICLAALTATKESKDGR